MYHVWAETRACAKDAAHVLRRKVVVGMMQLWGPLQFNIFLRAAACKALSCPSVVHSVMELQGKWLLSALLNRKYFL